MGISRMAVGRGLLEERLPNEVVYYDYPHAPLVRSIYPNVHRLVPRPYAYWEMELNMVAAGGWIASAIDLVRFNSRLDGLRPPALLKPETIQLMLEPPPAPPLLNPRSDFWYALAGRFLRTPTWRRPELVARRLLSWQHRGSGAAGQRCGLRQRVQ